VIWAVDPDNKLVKWWDPNKSDSQQEKWQDAVNGKYGVWTHTIYAYP
jgi:hypothetical protein